MDENEKRKKRAEDRRRWRLEHPEQVKEQKRRYREKHREDIIAYRRNHRRLQKLEIKKADESRGVIHLTAVQIDVLWKLFPNVSPTEAVRLLIAGECNRRVRF